MALDDHPAVERFCRTRMDAEDLYFGVSTRRNAEAGDLAHCLNLGALFADVDRDFDADRILSSPFTPGVVVESGTPGAYHLYCPLREPFVFPEDAVRARSLLRRFATWAGGDVASGECARVLRTPNTLNRKRLPARPVRVIEFHPERRYNASDFEDWLPVEPAMALGAPLDLSRPVREFRNVTLYKLGRALKGKQLPPAVIATTLRSVNAQHCVPPLAGDELEQIIVHVLSQPDRPFPTTPRVRVEVAADVS
jgi:hypothetical protein